MGKMMSILKSLLFAYLVTSVMLLLLAFVLYRMEPGEQVISIGIAATYFCSCFFGGFLSGKQIKEKRFFWGLLVGVFYVLLLFFMSMIFEPGAMANSSYIASACTLCIAGGMLGGMLS